MARRIIPLKYKGSPVKNATMDNALQGLTLGLFDGFGGKTDLEEQFGNMKDNLINTDVSQNFYKDLVNPTAGLTDHAAALENTAEDLTVNQKQFTQDKRQFDRGISSALESSKQTGTFNAQAFANQVSQKTGDMSAKIGEQESRNQMAKVAQASDLQKLKAKSSQELEMKKAEGEFQTDMQIRKGDEDALGRNLNYQQAMLGLVSGEIARADQQEKDDEGWLTKIGNIF